MHFALGPHVERQLARGREIAEILGIESRNQRQHVLEQHLAASGRQVHRNGAALLEVHPTVERQGDGVKPERIVRECETVVLEVGGNRSIEFGFGAAQQGNPARDETHLPGIEPQREVGPLGRHVAPQPQRQRSSGKGHAGGIVLVTNRRIGNPEITQLQPERRRFGLLLGLLVGFFVRGLHDVPVHSSVGQFVSVQRRGRKDDFGDLEPLVAEERQQVDDHRNTPCGNDGVALETLRTHEGQPLELDRRMGEMAQQTDVQLLEIEFCRQHGVGLALDDFGHFAPQRHRSHNDDRQQYGRDNGRNPERLLHVRIMILRGKDN